MTRVFLKLESEPTSYLLTEVPFSDLDSLIPVISAWSVNGDFQTVSGQFVIDDTHGARFEVTAHDLGEN